MAQRVKEAYLEWVIVCSAELTNGAQTGKYRDGESIQYGAKIAHADGADFRLRQVTNHTYLKETLGISY